MTEEELEQEIELKRKLLKSLEKRHKMERLIHKKQEVELVMDEVRVELRDLKLTLEVKKIWRDYL